MNTTLRISRRKRRLAILAGLGAAVVVAGSASAFWSNSGNGTGNAQVGLGNTIKATADIPGSGFLFPSTSPNGTLALTLTSPVDALVTNVAKDSDRDITSSVANCEDYIEMNAFAVNIAVSAGVPLGPLTFANKVRMLLDAPANCQGATFEIPVFLTAQEN